MDIVNMHQAKYLIDEAEELQKEYDTLETVLTGRGRLTITVVDREKPKNKIELDVELNKDEEDENSEFPLVAFEILINSMMQAHRAKIEKIHVELETL